MNARTGGIRSTKQKRQTDFPEESPEKMKDAFEVFKKEALQRKKLIRTGESSTKEFTDWIYVQSSIIEELVSK